MKFVDQLFEFFFSEKFTEEGQTFITGAQYREAIEERITGDDMENTLIEKFAEDEPAVTRQQIRDMLAKFCLSFSQDEIEDISNQRR